MAARNPLAPSAAPDAWRERLIASRTSAGSPANHDGWMPIRRQFQSVTAHTRALLRRPLEFPVLRQMVDRALQLSQLALDELNAAEDGSRPAADVQAVAALLDANVGLLNEIGRQQRLIDSVHVEATPLQDWTDAALQGTPTGARWLSWADNWLTAVRDEDAAALWPAAGVALDEALSRAGRPAALWTVHVLSTARIAAAVTPLLLEHDPDGPRSLVVASLLQNLALWETTAAAPHRERLRIALDQHPASGAAVLSTDPQCPATVALLVGLHEERVDGSGSPRGLRGRDLPRRAVWLGLLSRFAELVHRRDCHAEAVTQSVSVAEVAGVRLWREAQRGAFPIPFVRALLEALEPGLAECVAEQVEDSSQLFVDRQHRLPEPHREAQQLSKQAEPLAAPLFLRWRNGGVRLAYAPSAPASDVGGAR